MKNEKFFQGTLEIVKHLFNVKGLVFIFSLDIGQLSHSVKTIYGDDFDAIGYLERFFNYMTLLPTTHSDNIIQLYCDEFNIDLVNNANEVMNAFKIISRSFNLSLRDMRTVFHNYNILQRSILLKYRNIPNAQILYFYFLTMKYKMPVLFYHAVNSIEEEFIKHLSSYKVPFIINGSQNRNINGKSMNEYRYEEFIKSFDNTSIENLTFSIVNDSDGVGDYRITCFHNKRDELSIAQTYVNIASVYCKIHNYQVALSHYKNALAIQERLLGINHPTTATTIENIASIHYNLSNLSESLDWHYRALNILTNTLGENHPDIANIMNNIGVILDDQGKYNEALEYYHKALIIFEKVFGRDNADTAQAYYNIALNYSNRGEHQKAIEWYKKALLIFSNVFGTSHPLTVTIKRNIKKLNHVCKDKTSKNEIILELPLQSANNLPNPEISSFTEWYASLSSEVKSYNDNEFRQFLNNFYSSIKKIKEDSEFFINNNSPELCQYTKLRTL